MNYLEHGSLAWIPLTHIVVGKDQMLLELKLLARKCLVAYT